MGCSCCSGVGVVWPKKYAALRMVFRLLNTGSENILGVVRLVCKALLLDCNCIFCDGVGNMAVTS